MDTNDAGGIPSAIDGPSSAARLPSAQQVHPKKSIFSDTKERVRWVYPITMIYKSHPRTNRPSCNACPVSMPWWWRTICRPLLRAAGAAV